MNTRQNILITIFIITTILLACFSIYLLINMDNLKTELQNTTNNYEQKITNLNEELSNNKENTTDTTNNFDVVYFDNSKAKEKEDYEYTLISRYSRGIVATLNNNNTVQISFNNDTKQMYPTINDNILGKLYTITPNSKVLDIQLVPLGTYSENSVLLFLLEDKIVEYLTLEDMIINNNFSNLNKIPNISNIAKIDGATHALAMEGRTVPIAIDTDGYFYDLSTYIK